MDEQSSSHQLGLVRKWGQRRVCRHRLQATFGDQDQGMAAGEGLLMLLYSVVSSSRPVLGAWLTR